MRHYLKHYVGYGGCNEQGNCGPTLRKFSVIEQTIRIVEFLNEQTLSAMVRIMIIRVKSTFGNQEGEIYLL